MMSAGCDRALVSLRLHEGGTGRGEQYEGSCDDLNVRVFEC